MKLFDDYELNLLTFKDDFKDSSDFLLKELKTKNSKMFLACMDGLVNSLLLSQMIVEPICDFDKKCESTREYLELLQTQIVHCPEQNEVTTFDDAYYFLMSGFAVVVIEGCSTALAFGVQGWSRRDTSEPSTEANVKGAKECFVETLNDNKALLRKRLKTYHLKQKQLSLGNPENKMSKSDPDGCVFLMDKPEDIMRKFKRAVTDCETAVRFDKENKPGISNLLTIYCAATGKTIEQAEAEFADQGYGVFKPAVGEAVVELVRPIREKTEQLLGDKAYLESIYKEGAERASYLANKTLRKVYKKVGFVAR